MAESIPKPPEFGGGLHVELECQDWVAIRGTASALGELGRLLVEFSQADGKDCRILDSPSTFFQPGSLGLYLYRTAEADRPA